MSYQLSSHWYLMSCSLTNQTAWGLVIIHLIWGQRIGLWGKGTKRNETIQLCIRYLLSAYVLGTILDARDFWNEWCSFLPWRSSASQKRHKLTESFNICLETQIRHPSDKISSLQINWLASKNLYSKAY